MNKSITLHRKHGLNPTMTQCYICGKEKGEIALLGAAYKEEAPMKMIVDTIPCNECKKMIKKGIVFISVRDGEKGTNPHRTGRILCIKEEAVKKIMKSYNPKNRVYFIEDSILDRLTGKTPKKGDG